MNRKLVECAKYMLFEAKLLKHLWAEPVTAAAFVVNRSPSRVLNETTPYEKWTGTDGYHSRTKHIDVRHHFVRDKVVEGHIDMQYVQTDMMVADALTKATPYPKLRYYEQETKRRFAVIQIQLDKIFDFLKSKSFSSNDFPVEANTKKEDDVITQKNITFPINSIEQLDLLENELMNADFEKALVKKFSKISGTSGIHKIAKIGLQITKFLFTDELLNHFTWKGIKGCSKPPFMQYIRIRNCFYKIAHLADSSCTSLEADSFLQNSAIKHSGQRIKRKSGLLNTTTSKKKNSKTGKSTTTTNNKSVESDQEKEQVMNINLETPNIEDEENLEEVMNTNQNRPNIVDKENEQEVIYKSRLAKEHKKI